jgi:hypothetical protein
MPNLLWEKMKPFVMQVSFFTMIGLTAWFGVSPLLSTIQTKMDDIQKLSVTREHRVKQLEQLPELEAQYALINEHDEQLAIILTKDHLVEFIETLERLAIDEGVIIEIESRDNAFLESKITATEKKETAQKSQPVQSADKENAASDTTVKRPPAAKDKGILAELPLKKFLKLTVTVTGEYGGIVRYLQRIETLPYALDVIGMNMKERLVEGSSDLIAPESGALNPFGEARVVPVPVAKIRQLDAVFETVVYMKD